MGTKVEKRHSEGKNVRRTLQQRESGNGTKNYSGKATYLNKQKEKKKEKKTRVATGAPAYRRMIERRAAASTKASIKTKTKQNKNKGNINERRHGICKPNARGMQFAPLVASPQVRANQHEPACFGLSSPWSFPLRSGIIPLHVITQPWLSLQRSISP